MSLPLYFVGLDLGPAQDPTGLSILERAPIQSGDDLPVYSVRYLQRFHPGTPYHALAAEVRNVLARPPLDKSWVILIVDKTGCGGPVTELFRSLFPCMAAVTITAGQEAGYGPEGFTVPKVDLAATVQVLLQGRRLRVAQSLPEAPLLLEELQSFKVKVNIAASNESFEAWRERAGDDLVLAVALAAWFGERVAIAEREALAEQFLFDVYRVADHGGLFAGLYGRE